MSNTRKLRELNGGKLTRPRGEWGGKIRGRHTASPRRPADVPKSAGVAGGMLGVLSALQYQRTGPSSRRAS